MITLEDAIKFGKEWELSDKEIINYFIVNNNLEQEYIELIAKLSQNRINVLNKTIEDHSWLAYPMGNFYNECYNKTIRPEIASLLDKAVRFNVLGINLDSIVNALKGKTEEIDEPIMYHQPTLYKLVSMGVRFKNTDEDRIKALEKLWGNK